MAKLDSAKEEVGWLKILFAVVVAIDISLAAWAVQAYDTAAGPLLAFALVGILLFGGGALWINRLAYRRIKDMEGL
ncbi:MAG TPA: hypothetical protein VEQ87_04920 [Burkholderiales bacterium]|nr:hypothetical protein [Burkholderiales bacterium]